MPGSTPATSQLDWLISTTAITVLSWSKATRDLLKSFGWGIRALHQLDAATMVPSPRRLPHTISPAGESGFELLVPLPVGSGRSSVLWLLVAEQPYSAAISPQPKICWTERCQLK